LGLITKAKKTIVMQLKALLYLTALITLTAASCQDEGTKNNERSGLAGTWEWLSTDGGIAGMHYTPSSTGKTMTLTITSDLKFYRYENNVLQAQGTYALSERKCIHTGENKPMLVFSDLQNLTVENEISDTLELSDENYDGMNSTFKRIADVQQKD
jgi:hypothetical protein